MCEAFDIEQILNNLKLCLNLVWDLGMGLVGVWQLGMGLVGVWQLGMGLSGSGNLEWVWVSQATWNGFG